MPPAIKLLAVFALCLLPLAARAACPSLPAPQIIVTDDIATPVFDFSMDKAALNSKFSSIPLPNAQIYHLAINGVMSGALTADHTAQLQEAGNGQSTCLGLKSLNVTLRMRPIIYMASELRNKACQFKVMFEHELKHVAVDRAILQDYEPKMGQGLSFAFNGDDDSSVGPVSQVHADKAKAQMEARINGAITNLFAMLMRERLNRQHQVDGAGEYARISNACPLAHSNHP